MLFPPSVLAHVHTRAHTRASANTGDSARASIFRTRTQKAAPLTSHPWTGRGGHSTEATALGDRGGGRRQGCGVSAGARGTMPPSPGPWKAGAQQNVQGEAGGNAPQQAHRQRICGPPARAAGRVRLGPQAKGCVPAPTLTALRPGLLREPRASGPEAHGGGNTPFIK